MPSKNIAESFLFSDNLCIFEADFISVSQWLPPMISYNIVGKQKHSLLFRV